MSDPSQFNSDRTNPGWWTVTFSNPRINMFVATKIGELGRPRSGRIHAAGEMAMKLQRKTATITGGRSIELATARWFDTEGMVGSDANNH